MLSIREGSDCRRPLVFLSGRGWRLGGSAEEKDVFALRACVHACVYGVPYPAKRVDRGPEEVVDSLVTYFEFEVHDCAEVLRSFFVHNFYLMYCDCIFQTNTFSSRQNKR